MSVISFFIKPTLPKSYLIIYKKAIIFFKLNKTMKEKNNTKLASKLLRYGALTTVFAGMSEVVNGQIIYTDIDPDEGGAGVSYNLDLDNDANAEFVIKHVNTPTGNGDQNFLIAAPAVNDQGIFDNSILAASSDGFVYPFALNEGEAISAGRLDWNNESFQSMNEKSCMYENDAWCGVDDKYLGLRFKIGNNVHYGWARLDVAHNGANWLIKDYAYNSVAGEPIDAGQMPVLSVKEQYASEVRVAKLKNDIVLYNLPGDASYKVYALSGQVVANGIANTQNYIIETNSLARGMYVVEVTDVTTDAYLRKKVIL